MNDIWCAPVTYIGAAPESSNELHGMIHLIDTVIVVVTASLPRSCNCGGVLLPASSDLSQVQSTVILPIQPATMPVQLSKSELNQSTK